MKVFEIASYGGPEVLRLAERPMPTAGNGEMRIRVSASGVNRPDVLQRTGNYPVPPGGSDIPGLKLPASSTKAIHVNLPMRVSRSETACAL